MRDFLRGLNIGLRDGFFLGFIAGKLAGVYVNGAQAFGFLDNDTPSVGKRQFDFAQVVYFRLNAVGLKNRGFAFVKFHAVGQLRRIFLHKIQHALIIVFIVQQIHFGILRKHVARHLQHRVHIFMQQGRGRKGVKFLQNSLPLAVKIFHFALQLVLGGFFGFRAHNAAHAV